MHVRKIHCHGAPRELRPPLVRHRLRHVRVCDAEGTADRCGEGAAVKQHCVLWGIRREDRGQQRIVCDEDCARRTCRQWWRWEFTRGGSRASGGRGDRRIKRIWWRGLVWVGEGGAIGLNGAQNRLARLECEYAHVLVEAADI